MNNNCQGASRCRKECNRAARNVLRATRGGSHLIRQLVQPWQWCGWVGVADPLRTGGYGRWQGKRQAHMCGTHIRHSSWLSGDTSPTQPGLRKSPKWKLLEILPPGVAAPPARLWLSEQAVLQGWPAPPHPGSPLEPVPRSHSENAAEMHSKETQDRCLRRQVHSQPSEAGTCPEGRHGSLQGGKGGNPLRGLRRT